MILHALLVIAALVGPRDPDIRPSQATLVRRALAAAGGAAKLQHFRALDWDGTATVHIPGRDIALQGRWKVVPPDVADVATWEAARGPSATRRILMKGDRGWLQRDTTQTPMPAAMVAEERHQYYLYALLRILPLQQRDAKLTAVARDSAGSEGLRVELPGRLPVTMYFDREGRVRHVVTTFATVDGSAGDAQELWLRGTTEAQGVRWFRELTILRAGKPYFDLTVTTLRVTATLGDSL